MKWLSLMLVVVLGCSKGTTDKVEPSTQSRRTKARIYIDGESH